MLQTQTVEPRTYALLESLLKIGELNNFSLVGGTALSLLYGHRKSVDLDLFSPEDFNNEVIIDLLIRNFGDDVSVRQSTFFGIFCYIDDIKVDLVKYKHPVIRPAVVKEGIRMFSVEDIIAMKVQAILGRAKKKDFWDIAELLNHFEVKDFVELHKEKFSTQNLLITVPQAMVYFEDADEDENPISLKGQTWESVKDKIKREIGRFLI